MTYNFLISIIIPSYNADKLLTRAIDSVFIEEYKEYVEIIVVDDCSKINQKTFIPINKRVKFIKLEKNVGAGAARNKGIKAATGKYIAFIDADDFLLTDVFKKFLEYILLLKKDYDLIRINIIKKLYKNKSDVVLGVSEILEFDNINDYLKTIFLKKRFTTITNCSHIYSRKIFELYGFKEKYLNSEDLQLFFDVTESLTSILVTNFSYYYHDNSLPTSITSDSSSLYKTQKDLYQTNIKSLTNRYLVLILCAFYWGVFYRYTRIYLSGYFSKTIRTVFACLWKIFSKN